MKVIPFDQRVDVFQSLLQIDKANFFSSDGGRGAMAAVGMVHCIASSLICLLYTREQLIIASYVLSVLSRKETVTVNIRVSLRSVLWSPSFTEWLKGFINVFKCTILSLTKSSSLTFTSFDSDAIQSNCIDEDFVNDSIVHLNTLIKPFNHSVKLGDHRTDLKLTRILTATVSFLVSALKTHEAIINCSFMSMPGTTMIIGLPTILFYFISLIYSLIYNVKLTKI